ncbi:MAG: Uma2 family endonuclease [Polyangiaceae bacterium]|nr:Uma2 family endonuclease [Polyangiaceae bacterium]
MHHGARELHHHHGFQVPRDWRDWELSEETMPEAPDHAKAINLIEAILAWWARSQPNTQVEHNMGIRWDEAHPTVGLDPDASVFRPALPPDSSHKSSIHTWEPGYSVPILAIEVVSRTNSRKDYEVVPRKCESAGIPELCVFDPFLIGPRRGRGTRGESGPHRLQLWRHDANGKFKQVYAGDGPVYSPTLNGYFVAVDEGLKLRISDDEAGLQWWPTSEEVERKAKELAWKAEAMERAEKMAERAAKEAAQKGEKEALALVAELKALLAKATNSTKK